MIQSSEQHAASADPATSALAREPHRKWIAAYEAANGLTHSAHHTSLVFDRGIVVIHSFHDDHHDTVATVTVFFYIDHATGHVINEQAVPSHLAASLAEHWRHFERHLCGHARHRTAIEPPGHDAHTHAIRNVT